MIAVAPIPIFCSSDGSWSPIISVGHRPVLRHPGSATGRARLRWRTYLHVTGLLRRAGLEFMTSRAAALPILLIREDPEQHHRNHQDPVRSNGDEPGIG